MSWSKLNNGHPIILEIIDEWQTLILSNKKEDAYHAFIKKHANLFLSNSLDSFFSISKLKLGSELELDFAVPHEGYSKGLEWELIEIEKPQDAPYTESGNPSAALTHATQQIRDWQNWIKSSRNEAKKLFATWGIRTHQDPNFRFTVIIGTRQNSEKWLEKRNQYAIENNIEIRSFDNLSDRLKAKPFLDSAMLMNGNWDSENIDLCKKLANPFAQSFTDSEWKDLLREPNISGQQHFTSKAADIITSRWKINQELLSKFNQLVGED